MKNEWNKKAKRKHLRSCKKKHSMGNASCLVVGGKAIAKASGIRPILNTMLMDIVNHGGTISMSMEDGRLTISGKPRGMVLSGVSRKEAEE